MTHGVDQAQGALAIFHDVHAGTEADFEHWYKTEHFPERLDVPGFRLGRRFEAVAGAPRYFCVYFTDTPDVLTSGPYIERLNNPTPLTRKIMTTAFTNMNRTVCRRITRRGDLFGAFAVTVRFAENTHAPDAAVLTALAEEAGVARVEFWESADPGKAAAAEEALRGPDKKIAACVVVDTLRQRDAERVAHGLAGQFGVNGEIGTYRLLCELSPTSL
jgi:hypothetical protein